MHDDSKEYPSLPEGYNKRFCSRACRKEWEAAHPGKSGADDRQKMWGFIGKLLFVWPFMLFWKAGVFCVTNKYMVTIFSAGFSWLIYKYLCKVYKK